MMASAFRDYCEEGGFPEVVRAKSRSEKVKILQSYFSTMLFRDMMEHYHIGASSTVVRYFLKRVMNNLTKPTSVNNIYNDLKSQGLKVSKDSLYLWLDYACNIFLFRKVQKYTKSKQLNRVPRHPSIIWQILPCAMQCCSRSRGNARKALSVTST